MESNNIWNPSRDNIEEYFRRRGLYEEVIVRLIPVAFQPTEFNVSSLKCDAKRLTEEILYTANNFAAGAL